MSNQTTASHVIADTVPPALQREDQWVCWREERRDGKPMKAPINPVTGDYARVNDMGTAGEFQTAYTRYRTDDGMNGIGFVFHEDDPYVGVDIDACRDPDRVMLNERILEILLHLDSYTEKSPSGEGLHIILTGRLPPDGNRCGNIEFYDSTRFFTVTGDHLPGTPRTVEHRHRQLQAVHADLFDTPDEANPSREGEPTHPVGLSDDALLERARQAANRDKFRRLWKGDTSGYPSHSEADLALANILAFWTGGDPQRIERLFNKSDLMRPKWRDRPDYRERTIRTAIQSCGAYYDPATDE